MKLRHLFDMMTFKKLIAIRSGGQGTAAHATIMRHNLELLRDLVDALQMCDRTQIELEELRVEVLEAGATIASLVVDLEHERAHVAYLEERLAEFEDAADSAQRSRPPLRIVAFKQEPKDA